MATIFKPIRPDGVLTREEAAANTWPEFKRSQPLTPAQLDELRAKAPKNPDSHNARASVDIAERQRRQRELEDKKRAELAAAAK